MAMKPGDKVTRNGARGTVDEVYTVEGKGVFASVVWELAATDGATCHTSATPIAQLTPLKS